MNNLTYSGNWIYTVYNGTVLPSTDLKSYGFCHHCLLISKKYLLNKELTKIIIQLWNDFKVFGDTNEKVGWQRSTQLQRIRLGLDVELQFVFFLISPSLHRVVNYRYRKNPSKRSNLFALSLGFLSSVESVTVKQRRGSSNYSEISITINTRPQESLPAYVRKTAAIHSSELSLTIPYSLLISIITSPDWLSPQPLQAPRACHKRGRSDAVSEANPY